MAKKNIKKNSIKKDNAKKGGKIKREPVRPQNVADFHNTFKVQAHEIKNKMKRIEVNIKRRAMRNTLKLKERKQRQKLPQSEREQPQTIEDKQLAGDEHLHEYQEGQMDEFNQILNDAIPVKILITTSIKPPTKIYDMIRELMMIFHNINFYPRHNMKLDDVYEYARKLNYTHVIVVRFTHGWEFLVRHLEGPLAVFKITSVQYQKEIKHHGLSTDHVPQLILNNFDSKVGVRVGRMFASLFPQNPEFKGRKVVTFHNQRDFIFFRHHRYIFKEGYEGVNMQEIGPRMTFQLKKFYQGDSEKVSGVQFEARDNMYVDRKSVYL